MADPVGTAHQGTASSGQGSARAKFDEAAASTKSLSEQAMSAGRDLTDKAKDIAETSTDAIKGQASDLIDAAKDVASQATDKLKNAVNDRIVWRRIRRQPGEYNAARGTGVRYGPSPRRYLHPKGRFPDRGRFRSHSQRQSERRGSERAKLCAPSTDGLPWLGGPGGFWSRSFPQELVGR